MDIRFSGTAYLDVLKFHIKKEDIISILEDIGQQYDDFCAMVPFRVNDRELLLRVEQKGGYLTVLDIVKEFKIG